MPSWLGLSLSNSNEFHGELNPELCNLTSLRILDVGDDGFHGVIPSCFVNFTSMATEESVSLRYEETNYSYDGIPEDERLATKGNEYDRLLQLLSIIDLSNNNFSGQIPDELSNILGLLSLNLSGNQLGGTIPVNIGKMVRLEFLDLSRNHLSGSIPSSISQLSFLGFLNLSYNNLSGEIPLSTQMRSFYASSFVGNKLGGCLLTQNCGRNSSNGGNVITEEESDESGENWLYIFMGIGYVVGFWGCLFYFSLEEVLEISLFPPLWMKLGTGHML